MFALTVGGSQPLSASQDICLTPVSPTSPPVPLPYLNIGMPALAVKASTKVYAAGSPMITDGSFIPITVGDQAGLNGGIVSGSVGGKLDFLPGSQVVKIEGKGAIRIGCTTRHNNGNVMGIVDFPAQLVVMIMS